MHRWLSLAFAVLISLTAGVAMARSIGTYSGCKPLGRYKQACLDCVGGGNFWQSGQNVCGLPGAAKPKAAEADDAEADDDVESTIGVGGGTGILPGLWLMVVGVLGAAGLIVAKQPNAKDLIAKLAPYQGWIGAVSAIWGLWAVISAFLHLSWLSLAPVSWIVLTAGAVLQLTLGIVLGVGVIKTFVKHDKASTAIDETVLKLVPYQSKLGIAAIAVGVVLIVMAIA